MPKICGLVCGKLSIVIRFAYPSVVLQKVLNRTVVFAMKGAANRLTFVDMHSAYRRFDPVRGMDYQLHLNFIDAQGNVPVLKGYN